MEIFVNGAKADVTLDTEKNLGDVLKSFESECEKNNATTINIVVNGTELKSEDFESQTETAIEDIQTLELTTIALSDIYDAFKDISSHLISISEKLRDISIQFQKGQDAKAITTIKELAETFSFFCRIVTLSALFPEEFENLKIENKPVLEFFEDFSPIFNDFEDALKHSDSVLMGDLAEYEISPRVDAIVAMIDSLLKNGRCQ